VCPSLGPEPEAARQEVGLKDRFGDQLGGRLHDAVAGDRYRQRALIRTAGLGYPHPAGRQGPPRPRLQFRGQFVEQAGNPVLLDVRNGLRVDARRTRVAAHQDPRTLKNVSAIDLVVERVEPTSGIGLGRPVQRSLQNLDLVWDGVSRHRHSPALSTSIRTDEAAALPPRRLCCPSGSSGTTAASDAHPARHPLPGLSGYRARCSGGSSRRPPGRGGPPQFPSSRSERSVPHAPGSPSRLHLQGLHRFRGLRPEFGASALPVPHPRAGPLTTPQASLHATDRSVAPP
jgi:hypothetical protein